MTQLYCVNDILGLKDLPLQYWTIEPLIIEILSYHHPQEAHMFVVTSHHLRLEESSTPIKLFKRLDGLIQLHNHPIITSYPSDNSSDRT